MSNWQKVDSSAMTAVKFDAEGMHVRRPDGREYVHAGVSKATFNSFKEADSLGRYFNAHIAKKHPGVAS